MLRFNLLFSVKYIQFRTFIFSESENSEILRCNKCKLPVAYIEKDAVEDDNNIFILQCKQNHLYCNRCLFRLPSVFDENASLPLLKCIVCPNSPESEKGFCFFQIYLQVEENSESP